MTERTRTFSWPDPAAMAADARAKAGLAFLKTFPPAPIAECLGFRLTDVEEGRVAFELDPAEYHYNPIGTVHGGIACTLLDSAMGASVHSTLPLGSGYTTLELKVNLLRPITARTGKIRAEGKVIHSGTRVALAEARLVDGAGKLLAHATSTCLILRAEDGAK